MPQEIITKVYTIKELEALGDREAIDKAYTWLAECALDCEWWESIYMDAADIGAEIRGFNAYRRTIDLKLNHDAISVALAIKQMHQEVSDIYKLASDFISKHDEYHGVNGKITLIDAAEREGEGMGPYSLEVLQAEWEEIEQDFTRALGDEFLNLLEQEYNYIQQKEYLYDMAEANEYTFTADGKRFG